LIIFDEINLNVDLIKYIERILDRDKFNKNITMAMLYVIRNSYFYLFWWI